MREAFLVKVLYSKKELSKVERRRLKLFYVTLLKVLRELFSKIVPYLLGVQPQMLRSIAHHFLNCRPDVTKCNIIHLDSSPTLLYRFEHTGLISCSKYQIDFYYKLLN